MVEMKGCFGKMQVIYTEKEHISCKWISEVEKTKGICVKGWKVEKKIVY